MTRCVYRELVQTLGISPLEIAISGDSAGGGLTLLLLAAIRDEGLPMCACAVPISPWADLTNSGDSMKEGRDATCAIPRDSTGFLYLRWEAIRLFWMIPSARRCSKTFEVSVRCTLCVERARVFVMTRFEQQSVPVHKAFKFIST